MTSNVNSPSRSPLTVGSIVAETYRLEALIGRGGMGEVYAASHLRLPGKQVAIKFLHPEVSDADILARFRREAEIASRLGHPNIVTVLDFNSLPDGTPYLVLEYLVGETLADALARGPLALERTFTIARQVGSALAAAHRAGVVHRDLKPHNIFLVPTEIEGRIGETAKVLDFGISKIRGSQTVKTQDSALLGTPQYMAPEQAMGQHDSVDGRTDIFALGAILYEMLTGQAAFGGASIPEVVFKVVYEAPPPLATHAPGVPPHVIAAVERAMAKKADERFATVGELITALTGVGLATLPPGPAASLELRPPSRKVDSAAALAKTMGSGDHAAAMAATSAGLPSNVGQMGGAGSYGGHGGHGGHSGHGAMPSADANPAATPTAWERPRPAPAPSAPAPGAANRWKIITAVLGAVIAATVAFLLVRKPAQGQETSGTVASNGTKPSTDPPTTPTATVDAGVIGATAPQVSQDAAVPQDAATSKDAAAPTKDAATRPPRTTPQTTPRTPPPKVPTQEPAGEEPEELRAKLAKAWSQAEAGNSQAARTLANSIIDSPDATERARRQAHQINVLIACRADDRETAVRSAKRAGLLRPIVVAECTKHDIELPRRRN